MPGAIGAAWEHALAGDHDDVFAAPRNDVAVALELDKIEATWSSCRDDCPESLTGLSLARHGVNVLAYSFAPRCELIALGNAIAAPNNSHEPQRCARSA